MVIKARKLNTVFFIKKKQMPGAIKSRDQEVNIDDYLRTSLLKILLFLEISTFWNKYALTGY